MAGDSFGIRLRIVVEDALPNLAVALQKGAAGEAQLVRSIASAGDRLIFEFEVQAAGSLVQGKPRLLGPFVQGPPTGRFVYLCVGQSAGQLESPWRGRIKVPLGGIDAELAQTARKRVLEASIAGQSPKGEARSRNRESISAGMAGHIAMRSTLPSEALLSGNAGCSGRS